MKGPLERMNLRPAERRLVVAVALMLFFMLNLWLVVPHFSDLKKVQNRIAKARKTMALFEAEISQVGFYQTRLKELESENLSVPAEEQNIHFANTRERVAATSGVNLINATRVQTSTNQFFVELTQTINLTTKEPQLVSFLYNLGSGNSLIRVRDLSLRPDPSQQQLTAGVKLAASYQKKPLPRMAAPVQVGEAEPAKTGKAVPRTAADMPRRKAPVKLPPGKAAATELAPKPTPDKS